MSATIVQKSSSTVVGGNSHYFECSGDLFQTVATGCDQQQQQQQQQPQHKQQATAAALAEHVLDTTNMELSPHNLPQQHRLHGALTRTISQPAAQQRQQQQQQILHQQQQQPQPVASLVTIIENLGSMNLHRKLERTQSEPLPQQPMNTSRYKTELCRPYEEAGECKYGEKCQFAHGYHELRNLQRHPKYKTEYCRTFHSVGFCPYGPRCHFVHNADEARAQQAAQAAKSSQQQQQQQQRSQQQQQSLQKANQNSINQQHQQQQQQMQQNVNISQYFLPLSPPLSMSTGSDRESPTGSLSLSPTNSVTNFPFHDALPMQQQQQQQQQLPSSASVHAYLSMANTNGSILTNNNNNTPSSSSGSSSSASSTSSASGLAPATPPESPNVPISPVHTPPPYDKQLLQKSASTPMHEETQRLPVFNRLSSAVEAFQQHSNLGL
ncbi:protein TIS11 [Drosophila tropicalis]|uniref:protein TIS11 n=1 Tax=Drosophila tropicalis TaxID=46794 RepID=UPI0035ABC843